MSDGVENKKRYLPAATAAGFLVLIFCVLPLRARRATLAAPSAQTREASNLQHALKDSDLAAFFDEEFAGKMCHWHIPGAVIVVVHDGKIAFAQGYGYANVQRKLPIISDRTEFRIGSVSKLFVATAVMQLAGKHQVDLHADVNRYLKSFQVRDHFAHPVTLAELLTHTAGFDEHVIGLAARRASDVPPLGSFLAAHLPPLVNEPGTAYSYSNYGMALAAFVVQQVSGLPFDRYVEQNILARLGMLHTSFGRTPDVAANLATGYVYHDGSFEAEPYDYFTLPPASGMNSTAQDMAHFMLAHLGNGSYDGARILDAATAQQMHARQFAQDTRLPGRTYGFYERYRNGVRGIGHGGNIRGYGSLLFLLPDEHAGLFISANRDEPRFLDEIEKDFLDRFYPAPNPWQPPAPPKDFSQRASRFTGWYRTSPYSHRSFEKLATLYWQYHITANADGTLTLHYPHDYLPASRWVEAAPMFFERLGDENRAVFKQDVQGRITQFVIGATSFEKMPWYEVAWFQVRLVKSLLLIFLSTLIIWPVAFVIRRFRRRDLKISTAMRAAQWCSVALSLLNLVFVVGWMRQLNHFDLWDFAYGIPAPFRALLYLPPASAVLTVALVFWMSLAWAKRWWGVASRGYFTLVTAAALTFFWFLVYWNLL